MKPLFSICLFALALTCSNLNALEIKHVHYKEKTADDLTRIGEHFTGEARHPGRIVAQSQTDSREGLYFILFLDSPLHTLPSDASATIEILRDGQYKPETFTMELGDAPQRGRELYLGLTGSDWPVGSSKPTAWRVSIRSGSEEIAVRESFLWQ